MSEVVCFLNQTAQVPFIDSGHLLKWDYSKVEGHFIYSAIII